MDPTILTPALSPSLPTTPHPGAPRPGRRREPRPARPRATTTVSAAILTDRGLAEGYVALPLARLMAHRVWPSVEALNQQLVLLEQHSFTRMTSDRTFETLGTAFAQLLRAYAALTAAVAALAQRLAQNRLTAADRLALATGHLLLLLPAVPPAHAPAPHDPAAATLSTEPATLPDAGPGMATTLDTLEPPADLLALIPPSHDATHEEP